MAREARRIIHDGIIEVTIEFFESLMARERERTLVEGGRKSLSDSFNGSFRGQVLYRIYIYKRYVRTER